MSMTLRIFGFSTFPFVLGVAFLAAITPALSISENTSMQDDRAADREAIRAHIDSIFQAFINKRLPQRQTFHKEFPHTVDLVFPCSINFHEERLDNAKSTRMQQ
jgi:hypothetical protein